MVGQFMGWLMEIWHIVVVWVFAFDLELTREVLSLVKYLDFCMIPLVQILTSPPIKSFLKEKQH
jgi:hypothetical protein